MRTMSIKIGDRAVHKNGGPVMTVESFVAEHSFGGYAPDRVWCRWESDRTYPHRAQFWCENLVPAPAAEPAVAEKDWGG